MLRWGFRKKSGVATQILSEEKRAIYTHCHGHALNLAVSTTMKRSQICNEALVVAFEICRLVKYSPKRNNAFDQIKADCNDETAFSVGIRKFCTTRWTVRGESISSIIENYNVLKQLWDECLEQKNAPDIKGRIIGVNTQMSKYKLLFGLCLCERIFKITDNLIKTIQYENMSASEAQVIVKQTVTTLEKMRTADMFTLFFKYVDHVRENTHTDEPSLPRKRKVPKWFEGQDDGYHSSTVEDHYRILYFEAFDLAVSSIKERFDQPGYILYQNLEDYSTELQSILHFYGDDFNENELLTQLQIFTSSFTEQHQGEVITLQDIISFFKSLSKGQRLFYKQLCWVVRLILVLPSTNAASERSFSTMKRLKSYLRSTMGQSRLNHLMILNIYKEILDKMNLIDVAEEFVQGNEHRLQIFGKFHN